MPSPQFAPVFFLVAAGAFYTLFVVGGEHQLIPDCVARCKSGEIRAIYTGFPGFDTALGVLVAFFDFSGSLAQGPPLITVFGTVYSVALVLIHLESARLENPPLIRHAPLVTGLLCQAFGAGIFLPLYFALYSFIATPGSFTGSPTPIKTLLPAFLLAFQPLAALTVNPGGRLVSRDAAQIASALWQVFPIWTAIIHGVFTLGAGALSSPPRPGTSATPPAEAEKRKTLKALLAFTTLLYWVGLAQVVEISQATGKSVGGALWSIVDFPFHPARGAEAVHVFLLWDFLFSSIATGTFVLMLGGGGWKKRSRVALEMVGLAPVVGPGAAMSWGALRTSWSRDALASKKRE